MNLPLISIVIPTYNRAEMLGDALQTLLIQQTNGKFEYEIVVVDNASTDQTRSVVEKLAADAPVPLRYFYHDAATGDAPTRNRGLAESRGSWVALFDDDQLAAPDWLWQLYETAKAKEALVVGGAVHLHLSPEVLAQLGPYVRRTSFRETVDTPHVHPFKGKHLPGCGNAMVAREVFDKLGSFDASMAWGGSDMDFFKRVRDAGFSMYFTPHAIIRHRIPVNRLTEEYFRWDAHQGSDLLAVQDLRYRGQLALMSRGLARAAQALFVLYPGLLWARVRNNRGEMLDYRVRLWRVTGYTRRAMALLAPKWFSQERYFSDLKFRKGRAVGQNDKPLVSGL